MIAAVGISAHSGWAVLVSVAQADGELTIIDRRRVELIDAGLPNQPYHHECTELPPDEAQALVDRVKASVWACSRRAFAQLVADLGTARLVALAIREEPDVAIPDTVAEVLRSYQATCTADGAMYRTALRAAAADLGLELVLHRKGSEIAHAASALGTTQGQAEKRIAALASKLGPPWRAEHRSATAAAIHALGPVR